MKRIEVVAAVIIRGGRVFATQRGYGEMKGGWEFPGGKIEPGEGPEAALAREIREELACDIDVGPLLRTIEYDYPSFHLSMRCYRCTLRRGEPQLLEHTAACWADAAALGSLPWLPADLDLLPEVRRCLGAEQA